jgi:plastocyanin
MIRLLLAERTFMRTVFVFISLIFSAQSFAHNVSGTVEVILKGEKKKPDLSSVIVYLDPVGTDAKIDPAVQKKQFVMSTKNKSFVPRALAVPLGATVSFPNYDSIFHNLFSVSTPNQFDLGLYKGGASKSKSFEHPGIVKVFCNVHPQMSATIIVSASKYFTLADKAGNFDLGLVPNGSFALRAYADEGQATQPIQVSDTPLKLKLIINGRTFKKVPHKNKFGKDYATNEDERY